MTEPTRRQRRWKVTVAATAALAAVAALLGVALLTGPAEPTGAVAAPTEQTSVPPTTTPSVSAAPPATRTITPSPTIRPIAGSVLPPSKPAWLEIPSIGVRTGQVIELGLEPDGALQVPGDAVTAGWFTQSPTPGEVGPSVIAGHVDYRHVPGVFHRLHQLRPGAEVTVHRGDGTSAVFTVDQVQRYPKSRFPTERVYGNTESPELRLITCGGAFDRSSGEYVDNVVAYARMTSAYRR